MNSDYIVSAKNTPTLFQPNWAESKGGSLEKIATANVSSTDTSDSKKVASNATIRDSKKSFGPDVDTVDVTFGDLLDTLNPLQHIPIVNMVYREMTGDKISGVSQVAGSALYGGPLGIISGVIDAIFEQEKGASAGETIVASLMEKDAPTAKLDKQAAPVMVAETKPEALPETAPIETHIAAVPAAAKQPFGGVMGNTAPVDVAENEEADTIPLPENKPVAIPAAHKPVDANGQKFFSLAGVVHRGASDVKMPTPDSPDVRLKSFNLKSATLASGAHNAGSVATFSPENGAETSHQLNEEALLGLGKPTEPLAAAPGFSPLAEPTQGSNPLPPQLIQDMMLLNMQKYQNGLKNGTLRGATVDVAG